MGIYQATKNLIFSKLGKGVIVGETIELEPNYAKEVNEKLKLTFPDVEAVLVSLEEEEKPKATTRKKKTDKQEEE